MNLHPKLRPLWQRILILPPIALLMVYKALHLPTFFLPRAVRSIVNNWTYSMFWMVLKSRLTRAYIDQPCRFKVPEKIEPKVAVPEQYQLSQEQLRQFYTDGFVGPFDAFDREGMADFRNDLLAVENTTSQTYNFVTPRDRHLEMPRLWRLMKSPAITDRVAQILGPDLLCWRSQIFFKGPRAEAIQWHQASTFMVEDYLDPAIFPPQLDEMFQITVWVAVDDATLENGCIEFVRGTHDQIRTVKFGGEKGFYNARFTLEFDRDPSRIVKVPVKSGQFLIFAERCIHGSGPNRTDRHRVAFNFRVVPTNTPVYPDKEKYRSVYNGGKYYLNKWGVSLLRGEDHFQLSRTVDPLVTEIDVPARPLRKVA